MKNVRRTVLSSSCVAFALFLVSACAGPSVARRARPPVHRRLSMRTAAACEPVLPDTRIVRVLEWKMRRSRGTGVFVSKKLLRELLHEHRVVEADRMRLNDQLEALKKIDGEADDGSHPVN